MGHLTTKQGEVSARESSRQTQRGNLRQLNRGRQNIVLAKIMRVATSARKDGTLGTVMKFPGFAFVIPRLFQDDENGLSEVGVIEPK